MEQWLNSFQIPTTLFKTTDLSSSDTKPPDPSPVVEPSSVLNEEDASDPSPITSTAIPQNEIIESQSSSDEKKDTQSLLNSLPPNPSDDAQSETKNGAQTTTDSSPSESQNETPVIESKEVVLVDEKDEEKENEHLPSPPEEDAQSRSTIPPPPAPPNESVGVTSSKPDSFSFPKLDDPKTEPTFTEIKPTLIETNPTNNTPIPVPGSSSTPSPSPIPGSSSTPTPTPVSDSIPSAIVSSEEALTLTVDESHTLPELIAQTRACLYQPMEFFVAWQGVLTVAYTGLPPSIIDLKEKIVSRYSFLSEEFPGSKWPKTTIGCLKDGKRLKIDQLQTLRTICSEASFPLIISPPITVENLSVVLYENACLEKIVSKQTIALKKPLDSSPPSNEERQSVKEIVNEFDTKNLTSYWFHASKDGNRSSHYRTSKLGFTLVHFLGNSTPMAIGKFKEKVEKALPDLYDWFGDEQLHITIRAIS